MSYTRTNYDEWYIHYTVRKRFLFYNFSFFKYVLLNFQKKKQLSGSDSVAALYKVKIGDVKYNKNS